MPELRLDNIGPIDKPGDSKEETLDHLTSLYDTAQAARRPLEAEWQLNAKFVVGSQWDKVIYDDRLRATRIVSPREDSNQSRVTSNFVYSLLRQAMTAFRGKMGRQICVPATLDAEDVYRAEVGTDVLHGYYDTNCESERRFQEANTAAVCGRNLRMTRWNGDLPGQSMIGSLAGMGDVESITLSPMRTHIDPWCERFDDAKFVIVSDLRDIGELKELFPGKEFKAEAYEETTHLLDQLIANVSGAPGASAPQRKDMCILKQLYVRPTAKWPNGRLFWFVKGQLLEVSDLPDGIFPFDAIDWFPVPMRSTPLPFITPLRDPQKQYNILLSQLIDLSNRQLRGDVVSDSPQSVKQTVDPKTGRKDIYVPGATKWELMRYDLNASNAQALLERTWTDAQQLAGVRDPSMGEVPSQVSSGLAISLLQSGDDKGLNLLMLGMDASYEKISRKVLELIRRHYIIPRLTRMVGDNKLRRVQLFQGSDIEGVTDVRTRTVNNLSEPEQMAQRQQAIDSRLYGPYDSISHKVASCRALLNTKLPNIEDEVEDICSPHSFEELKQMANEMDVLNAQAQAAQMQMAIAQAEMLRQQGQAPPEQGQAVPPQGAM